MKSGEVAVENSVNAFRDLKSAKLKTRAAMAPFGSPSHPQKLAQPLPQFAPYQPHLFPPVQMPYHLQQQYAVLPSYSIAQPLMAYHRYNTATATMNHLSRGHSHQVYQQPPPPPPQQYSGVKRTSRPNQPPVSMPMQLQASADMGLPRARSKRSVCLRFARGNCQYGATCKFAHDATIQFSDMPQSAPGSIATRTQSQVSPLANGRLNDDNQRNIPNSLHDSNFPSLSAEAGAVDKISDDSASDNQFHLSPSKKLVFRDAVLKQTRKSAEVSPLGWPSSVEISTSCDEESAVETSAKNRCLDSKEDQNQVDHNVHIEPVGDPLRQTRDPVRRTDKHLGHKGYQLHQTPHLSEQHFFQRQPVVVLPPSGQPGYAIQPVYLANQGGRSDNFAAFSFGLSREANDFVQRIDSKLRALTYLQQRAIAKLQEVATNIWNDSTINIYGSNFTRLALPHSDIDCVLASPSVADMQPAELLKKFAAEVRRLPWARRVELLCNAKIPVLKIVFCQSSTSTSEVMLDLTCAHSPGHSGLSARELIYSCQVEMPALRPLVLILKSHIERRGLNSAYTGGLSSYGLVLLVIRFLQACGDGHHVGETQTNAVQEERRGPSMSESSAVAVSHAQQRFDEVSSSVPPVYEFTRNCKLAWRTGLGNLLLLFLETYVTFDYRRFGITVEGNGQYFPLPSDKISHEPGAVVSPYIMDPIQPTRSIGSCFRMHDIIQAWYELYQQLTNGTSLENAISTRGPA